MLNLATTRGCADIIHQKNATIRAQAQVRRQRFDSLRAWEPTLTGNRQKRELASAHLGLSAAADQRFLWAIPAVLLALTLITVNLASQTRPQLATLPSPTRLAPGGSLWQATQDAASFPCWQWRQSPRPARVRRLSSPMVNAAIPASAANASASTLAANGSGTAGLTLGVGCGWNFNIQVSPDRSTFNLVDVSSANPGNFIAGKAVHR